MRDAIRWFKFTLKPPKNKPLSNEIDSTPLIESLLNKQQATKFIYWTLLEKHYPIEFSSKLIWTQDIGRQISDEDWWQIFPDFLREVYATKLRFFQYRVLTRTLTTNLRRSKWTKTIGPECEFCGKKSETLLHLLFEYEKVFPLWATLKR